jgi:hypothetical protein
MDFTVEYLYEVKSPDTSLVLPPDSILNKYLLPLARLYDERDVIPLLDTLIFQKEIHKLYISSLSLSIEANSSNAWVQNVMNGITPTGNVSVDSLVRLYNLRFQYFRSPGHPQDLWFETFQEPLNTYALGKAFRSVEGVLATTPNQWIYFFTRLAVTPTPAGTVIRFYYGYGDCFAGCFGYDYWTFSVDKNFDVVYQGHGQE